MQVRETYTFNVNQEEAGQRLDSYIAARLPSYSRSFCQKLIETTCVTINGNQTTKQATMLKNNDSITITFPEPKPLEANFDVSGLTIPIVYEHEHFIIINKPVGLNVHRPHENSNEISLVDWISARNIAHTITGHDRPGIVHRLDKFTSGLMIIARTNYAHVILGELFKNRGVQKTYRALVQGQPAAQGTISHAIARSQKQRHKMQAISPNDLIQKELDHQGFLYIPGMGKIRYACTNYSVLTYFPKTTLVEAYPITGRTHQIRVHFAALGHPLIGDATYGTPSSYISRQALHAYALRFTFEGTVFEFCQEEPEDFKNALYLAKNDLE